MANKEDATNMKLENTEKEIANNVKVEGAKKDDATNMKMEEVEKEDATNTKLEDDPYAYLERGDFSSEKFKIELRGLPKYYGMGQVRKLLNDKLKLSSSKLKPPRKGSSWMYVCFRSEEDKQKAMEILNGYVWKGNTFTAENARPAPDPLVKKRKQHNDVYERGNKKPKLDERSLEEKLKCSTTPLWTVPYEKQLAQKQDAIKKVILEMGQDIVRGNPALKPWMDQQREKYGGLPCELWDVRGSPLEDGYRNKCEFTVGINEETGERTVGFRIGSYVRGYTGVGPVGTLRHVPDRMKEAAKVFEKFVRASEFDVFNPETHEGYWRQLMARLATNTDQMMLVVGIHPQSLSEEELGKIKTDLKNFYETGEGRICKVDSLYFQHIMKRESGKDLPPLEHLLGETHIYETLLGLKFRVSPEAFFQVNTKAAELLYNSVIELSSPTEETTIVDICCGTGSIGLCLAQKCGQVLGLELLPQAIADAKVNAENNNITNCDFFAGRAEDLLSSVMRRATKDDIIAIVDPPRAGLHQKALMQLRRTEKLKKLVFLSCDPKAATKNFVDLTRPTSKQYVGDPLVPVRAVPVDMFPHTVHCELILYFERLDLNKVIKTEKKPEVSNHVKVEPAKVSGQDISKVEEQKKMDCSKVITTENKPEVSNHVKIESAEVSGQDTCKVEEQKLPVDSGGNTKIAE